MAKNITKGKAWWDGYRATCDNCGTSFDVERSDFSPSSDPTDASPRVNCPDCNTRITLYRPLAKNVHKRVEWRQVP